MTNPRIRFATLFLSTCTLSAVACAPATVATRTDAAAAASPASGWITVEPGVRLAYRVVGSGPETLVVPWPTAGTELDRLGSGRRLVLYHPRGRVASDPVDPSKVSLENELADLEAVRRHLGLEKMQLLGWSHYGMMTAVYAIRHPDRVSRLVQMTPGTPRRTPYLDEGMATMRARADAAAYARLEERKKAGEFANDPATLCRESRKVTTVAFVGDPADVAKISDESCAHSNEWAEAQGRWWGALFESMGDWDYRREARALAIPRLVVHGEKDFIPIGGSREWVAGNANARLLVIPGVGHFPHVERPEVYFPAVEAFLSGAWPPGAVTLEAAAP